MPTDEDPKRRGRAGAGKADEAQTAARAHAAAHRDLRLASPPLPDDYQELTWMSDEAVAAKTGRSRVEWVRFLDAMDAYELPHAEIAKLVLAEVGNEWWSQSVAVGYERIRGLREKGQRSTGDYDASLSRTFPVPLERPFAAFADDEGRARWLGADVAVTRATLHRSVRMRMPDGTPVEAHLTAKGPERSSVPVPERRLPSKGAAEAAELAWAQRFEELAVRLARPVARQGEGPAR